MEITVLMEDTASPRVPGIFAEHGLSLAVKTPRHVLLTDSGASARTWENAALLGFDPRTVDTVILSHGHYDHADGLPAFAAMNPGARIYLHAGADGCFYHGEKYIGMAPAVRSIPNLVRLDGDFAPDEELSVFSGVTGRRFCAPGSAGLTERRDGRDLPDRFFHEQYLVIRAEGKRVLLSGCAHAGIVNVLDRFREKYGGEPDAVISGFHLMKKTPYEEEDIARVCAVAEELAAGTAVYYTGHCTGEPAFVLMKEILGDRLRAIRAGDRFTL